MSTKKIPEALQSMLDIYQQPFVLVDRHFTIVASNKAYADQYNLTPEEIIGCKCHKVSHHSDVPCTEIGEDCPHRRMFNSGEVEEALAGHDAVAMVGAILLTLRHGVKLDPGFVGRRYVSHLLR